MSDEHLRELLISAKAMHVPPREVPVDVQKRFDETLNRYCKPTQISPEEDAKVFVLQYISQVRATDEAIEKKLFEHLAQIHNEGKKPFATSIILLQMESEGVIRRESDLESGQKLYSITELGAAQLSLP